MAQSSVSAKKLAKLQAKAAKAAAKLADAQGKAFADTPGALGPAAPVAGATGPTGSDVDTSSGTAFPSAKPLPSAPQPLDRILRVSRRPTVIRGPLSRADPRIGPNPRRRGPGTDSVELVRR